MTFDDKTNTELILDLKELEQSFEALKLKILKDYTLLEEMELTYNKINLELKKRLKG